MPLDDDVVDVDVFLDDHAGLIVAEVEFDSDDAMAAFEPPDWFGREVTDDDAFTNAALAARRSPNPPESVRHRWNRNGTRNRTEH